MKTRILSADDTRSLVRRVGIDALMDQLIDDLDAALRVFDPQHTDIPVRAGFDWQRPVPGLLEWMPACDGSQVTMKIVSYHAANPDGRGLPTVISTISAYEVGTGRLVAVVDGSLLTALRTGAASALASRVLARSDSRTLGLIGCGAQAVTQLHAISRLFPVERVLVHDADPGIAASFAQRVAFMDPAVEVVDVARAVGEADILCTATSVEPGHGPVLADRASRPWLHVNAVGSDFPGKTELPASLLRRAFVATDFPDQAMKEGECQQLERADIGATLADLVRDPGRFHQRRGELSVFDSTGWALEDQVVLDLFLRHADALGLGTEMAIEHVSGDPRNPYQDLHGVRAALRPVDGPDAARDAGTARQSSGSPDVANTLESAARATRTTAAAS